ncbi:MAG: hypothetical protein JNJ46_22615 [Myxococcales bacterium]|nr:hypothetical protein [Myxococcales bacterium]
MPAKSSNILLFTGTYLPKPAPSSVIDGFVRAEVTQDASGAEGFQLSFGLRKNALGEYAILSSGALSPFSRVILAVEIGTLPSVICDGLITHQQISQADESGNATLTVTGRDLSCAMDLQQEIRSYDNQPDSLIVAQLLARYARYKIIPTITPTPELPLSIWRRPLQTETDLRCIQRLAKRNGFVFHITPLLPGTARAYFGPQVRAGLPQRALSIQAGGKGNLRSIHFSQDALQPVQMRGHYLDSLTKLVLPLPAMPFVPIPPLTLFRTSARRQAYLPRTAHMKLPAVVRTSRQEGDASRNAVRAEGELDPMQYGGILKVRSLVGVRGAGLSYDGMYFVERVTHVLERGSYTQSFSLNREGVLPLSPVVMP